MMPMKDCDWVILHLPHSIPTIPMKYRDQFILNDEELAKEINLMTDHKTVELFTAHHGKIKKVCALVNRLVVDLERFTDDVQEEMASRGMGVVYTSTAHQEQLRRKLTPSERQEIIDSYYIPHHQELENMVGETIDKCGMALILDCHSFPSIPLPFEINQNINRADICIGIDDYHTPKKLLGSFIQEFTEAGYKVSINDPYTGTMVPMRFINKDKRVSSIMIEINRSLYMFEDVGVIKNNFQKIAKKITRCYRRAIQNWASSLTTQL